MDQINSHPIQSIQSGIRIDLDARHRRIAKKDAMYFNHDVDA